MPTGTYWLQFILFYTALVFVLVLPLVVFRRIRERQAFDPNDVEIGFATEGETTSPTAKHNPTEKIELWVRISLSGIVVATSLAVLVTCEATHPFYGGANSALGTVLGYWLPKAN